METYILKSAACLLALFAFYKLFLEKQNMHVFKRFYLLGALFIGFGIPFITFIEYIEIAPQPFVVPLETTYIDAGEQPIIEPINYWPYILWSLYFLGVAVFAIRFITNFGKLIYKIQRNPKIKQTNHTNVLLQPKITPHTFFKYVFLNKRAFEDHKIPKEVILHEAAHAKQKHSIDVVFIEFLQIIFWFNPLLYVLKKAIKLNHEFLADQAVLENGVSLPTYQELLLAFSSNANHPQLANAINYSSFKKRFTVMKTQTTSKAVWLRNLLLLPLLAVLVFSFSTKEVISNPIDANNTHQNNTNTFKIKVKKTKKGVWLKCEEGCAWTELTFTNTNNQAVDEYGMTKLGKDKEETDSKLSDFLFVLNKTNDTFILKGLKGTFWTDLSFTLSDDDEYKIINRSGVISQEKATKKMIAEYNAYIREINKKPKSERIYKVKDVNRIKYIYSLMSDEQKKNAEPFPKFIPPPPPQLSSKSNQSKSNYNGQFIKNWYITIDGNKYYYKKNTNDVWKYYTSNGKLATLNIVKEYQKKYKKLEKLKNTGQHYVYKSEREQKIMDNHFSDLGGMYFRMKRSEKAMVKRPSPPQLPYIKLVKKGKVYFKKKEELTEDDKKFLPQRLPPPPPPPIPEDATPEQKAKYKKAHEEFHKKYEMKNGKVQAKLPPPPPPPIPEDATPEQKAKYKKAHEEFYKKYEIKNGKVQAKLPPPPPPPIPEDATPEQKAKYKKAHQEYKKQVKSSDYNYTVSNNEEVKLVGLPEVIEVEEIPEEVVEVSEEIIEEPIPQEQKTGYIEIKGEIHYYVKAGNKTTYYNRWGQKVDKKGNVLSTKQTKATDVIHGQVISKVYKDGKVVSEFDSSDVNIPPPPPISPLEHIKKMRKKGAKFYFDKKPISSKEAIEILKKNPEINILTKTKNVKHPIVRLSTLPIVIEVEKPSTKNNL